MTHVLEVSTNFAKVFQTNNMHPGRQVLMLRNEFLYIFVSFLNKTSYIDIRRYGFHTEIFCKL